MSVRRDTNGDIGTNIMHAWKRFFKWLEEGKYIWGGRQYLEEHLGFNEEDAHIGGVELYLPIEKAPQLEEIHLEAFNIPRSRVAVFREEGEDGEVIAMKCWQRVIAWGKATNLKSESCDIYQYNKGFDRRPPCFHVIMIALPEGFNEEAHNEMGVMFLDYDGGKFMSLDTDITNLGNAWMLIEKWQKKSKIKPGKKQWVEKWILENWKIPAKIIKACYPI